MFRDKKPEVLYTVEWVDKRRVKILYKDGREFIMPAKKAALDGLKIPGIECPVCCDGVGYKRGMGGRKFDNSGN